MIKTLQIITSMASLILSVYFLIDIMSLYDPGEERYGSVFVKVFVALVAPATVVALGTVAHTRWGTRLAFSAIVGGSIVMDVVYFLMFLGFLIYSVSFAFAFITPALLATLTALLAFISRRPTSAVA